MRHLENIEKLKEKIIVEKNKTLQLERQLAAWEKQLKEEERKNRTRRLIQVGAITEQYLAIYDKDEISRFFSENIQYIKLLITNWRNISAPKESPTQKQEVT